jgi:hypothetical protein
MKKTRSLLGIIVAITLLAVGPVSAITDGDLDGNDHPYVGLLIFEVGGRLSHRCTGTLLSPTIMLTAGHCTDGTSGGRVWFDATEAEVRAKGYPFGGSGAIEFAAIATHPLFPTASFFVHDAGMVMLSEPVILGEYGALPDVDELDQLETRRGKQVQTFTAVGYGLQQITSNPLFAVSIQSDLDRYSASPHLVQINVPGFTGDFSLLLSNNHSTGGTCFGDSGGPNFIGQTNIVGAVTSFGLNSNCAGTGGVFRVDRQNVLDFINGWLLP